MIISISGKANCGKDTAGLLLQQHLPSFVIRKWAGPLRKIAALLLGVEEYVTYMDSFKTDVLPECWNTIYPRFQRPPDIIPMTGREFLQKLGTDAVRDNLHKDTWVNAVMSRYKCSCNNCRPVECTQKPNWIITDTRFPNELEAVKAVGGTTIRITRPSTQLASTEHESETALDYETFDYEVVNDGTTLELAGKLITIISKIKQDGNYPTDGKEN